MSSLSLILLILLYCTTISVAFQQRNLLQATSYRTITGTWSDDYQLAPPNNMGWTVKNTNGDNVALVTSDSYWSFYGPFTGDTDFALEKYYITQQFKCNVRSIVTISYWINFCSTEQSDYVSLYLNDQLTTTTTMRSGTEYTNDLLTTASNGCSPWEYIYLSPFYIPNVPADTLWKVQFEIGVNWNNDYVAISGISVVCTPDPTANPSKSPTPSPTLNPSYPTPSPTPAPTPVPTINPTPLPTHNPTMPPTRSPTNIPTYSPSKIPTISPSKIPTMNTNMPSKAPTNAPTFFPTRAEGSIGDGGTSTTQFLETNSKETDGMRQDDKQSGWIQKILFITLGFAAITCILLWIYFCYVKAKKKKQRAKFSMSKNINVQRGIEMQKRDGGNVSGIGGLGGSAHANKSKNKMKYSPFAGRMSPKKVQNKSLHQHIIRSVSNDLDFGVQVHQLSGLDSFMLNAVHDNDVDAIPAGNFSGGSISPEPNSMMFAASLQNENMVNAVMLEEVIEHMTTPMGDDNHNEDVDDDDMMVMHGITPQ